MLQGYRFWVRIPSICANLSSKMLINHDTIFLDKPTRLDSLNQKNVLAQEIYIMANR